MTKNISISYLIGTHNEESSYIKTLLDQILKHKDPEDEIIIIDDFSTSQETLNTLQLYVMSGDIKLHAHALNNDFASHKNYMNSLAKGDYIFNIDADETPNSNLLITLKEILINNPTIDLFKVPRINMVQDLPEEYIVKWGWRVNDKNFINFPDYQARIYKNKPEIKWEGVVHESIVGTVTHTNLPAFDEEGNPITDYALFHPKTFDRQLKQNTFYEQL
jgi:glycosyltransferase involved in cell wall biosynthesis